MDIIFDEYESNIKLLTQADPQTVINAINKITQLLFENTDLSSKYAEVENIFEAVTQTENDEILFRLAIASETLLEKDFIFFSVIKKIRQKNNPKANYRLAYLCSQKYKLIVDNKDFKNLFFSFMTVSVNDEDTKSSLDVTLSRLIEVDHEICYCFLTEWALKSDYCKNYQNSITQIWHCLFYSQFLTQNVLNTWISRLFSTDEPILYKIASDIIQYYPVGHINGIENTDFSFIAKELKCITIADIVFITKKVLGYILLAEQIFNLLFSLLDIVFNQGDKEKITFVKRIFFELIIPYPFLTKKFFESKQKETCTDKMIKSFITDMINQSDEYCTYLEQRKNLKELESAPQNIRDANKFKLRKDEKLKEEAHKNSVAALLCTTQVIKYGKGTRYFFDNTYMEPSLFHEFSYSVSLSSFDIFSPVNNELTRYYFRLEKRNKI